MRRQRLPWTIAVFGIFGTVYGAYLIAYHYKFGNTLNVYGLVLLILGLLALAFSIALSISQHLVSKRKKDEELPVIDVEPIEVKQEEEKPSEPVKPTPRQETKRDYEVSSDNSHNAYSSYSVSTIYVKQVGHGPLLRIEGDRILDMRINSYYRIEGNMVYQEGYGPVYEIRGNQIKSTFGGYLYEISGNNINKVYGGFYASISGNYITLFDLSYKYETTESLSKKQALVVAALLF